MEAVQAKKSNDQLMQAQAHIFNHIFNFINSMSLNCAVQLGIPDILHKHGAVPLTLSALVAALGISPAKEARIGCLMNLLVHSGIFAVQKLGDGGDEGYVLTLSSMLLVKENPTNLSSLVQMSVDPVLVTPWHSLSAWLQTSNAPTAFEYVHGKSWWDYTGVHPKFNDIFNEAMANDTQLLMRAVVGEGGETFGPLRSLVDVGGGTGSAARSIVEAFPQVKCTVFDLPHVVAGAEGSPGLEFIGGNMFESIPSGDAVFLKWILHCWNDEDCVKILKKCKEAIPSAAEGGKVIIVEMVCGAKDRDHEYVETQLLYDMLMMESTSGQERDEASWKKLFKAAGFSRYKIIPVLGLRSLIELYP